MSGSAAWADGFITVDWGTTNRRAYAIGPHGACTGEMEDGSGVVKIARGGFDAAVAQIRERLGDRPMLLAGMVGSNRGWIEAPYVHCPAGIDDLAGALAWVEEGRTAIVPGVSFSNGRCDVMRGEEVQLLGAVECGAIPRDCLVCHPGTHNKWVRMQNGRIDGFRTVMTGELFNLLKDGSILSELLGGQATDGDAFREGVRRGLSGQGITSELFEARAAFLLGRLSAAEGASLVSGLLIGEDVRVGLESFSRSNVYAMGRADLTRLYSAALAEAGVEGVEIDGEDAFIAGACSIVERLKP